MGGEAKRRGTFEQRKAQAIQKREEEEKKEITERIERLAAMTPEERKRLKEAQMRAKSYLGLVLGMSRMMKGLY